MSSLDLPAYRRLSDGQISMVLRGALPLQRIDRDPFYAAVAELLTAEPIVGDGVLHRIIVRAQRQFEVPQPPVARYPGGRYHRPGLEPLE